MTPETSDAERQSHSGRPYRSHIEPACLPCRTRKSRCLTRPTQRCCVMCETHGTPCAYPQVPERRRRRHQTLERSPRQVIRPTAGLMHGHTARARRPSSASPAECHRVLQAYTVPKTAGSAPANGLMTSHISHSTLSTDIPDGTASVMTETGPVPEEGTAHVVSPAIADDDRVFQEYLSNGPSNQSRRMVRSHSTSSQSSPRARAILFHIIPKRGEREAESRWLAQSQLTALEELIGPYLGELVDLFFTKVNICFPIFEETMFRKIFTTNKASMSPSLLCHLYGNALTYWRSSSRLIALPRPEQRSAWLHSEDALNAEWKCTPGISLIIAIVLNLCGRPSNHCLGNGMLLGMAVALANSFALNRGPSHWNLSPSEKRFRIRIWWLLVVYDVWSSLAYGTPPRIQRAQCDVPMLVVEDILECAASGDQTAAASCFVALVTLTRVLSVCLDHLYNLDLGITDGKEDRLDLDSLLVTWEDSLAEGLRRSVIRGTNLSVQGTANLRLAYLSVKLLVCRIQLNCDKGYSGDDIDSHHCIHARRVCEEMVDFVQELDEDQLGEFWIPPLAHCLTSATTFLMRIALRSRGSARNPSLKLARTMVDTLHTYRHQHDWDMADNCLANCGDLIEKVELACDTVGSSPAALDFSFLEDMDFTAFDSLLEYQ